MSGFAQGLSSNESQLSPSFSQSGQVDWVELGRLSVSCTWDVAARLCNAGIATVTVIAGRGLSSIFHFPAESQRQFTESLSDLRGASPLSKVVWFGFGLKHIVYDLCTTEAGTACVALCAAMTIPYSSFHAAQIWRDLCELRGAPHDLIPARTQWAALVDVCAGCLTQSKFSLYYNHFCRLLGPNEYETRSPALPRSIAKALGTLADLSKGGLVSAIFIGGTDCAWLASVAEYLLQLRIQIEDEHGRSLHWSNNMGDELPAQAIFRRQPSSNLPVSVSAIAQRVCYVSSGEILLQESMELTASSIRRSSSWSCVFCDTFSVSVWNEFNTTPIIKTFSELIECVALHSHLYFSQSSTLDQDDGSLRWLYWPDYGCLYHPRRSGSEFLKFARETFPELKFLPNDLDFSSNVDPNRICSIIMSKVHDLSSHCGCIDCTERPSAPNPLVRRACLTRIALMIIRFILILAPVEVHNLIPPATSGLLQLYNRTVVRQSALESTGLPCHGVPLILFLFTGHLPTNHIPKLTSAASAGGVCCSLRLLKDASLSPLEATTIDVMPGHIRSHGRFYTFLVDTNLSYGNGTRSTGVSEVSEVLQADFSGVNLMVEEQEQVGILSAIYKLSRSGKQAIFISPAEVQRSLKNCLRTAGASHEFMGAINGISNNFQWSFRQIDPLPHGECLVDGLGVLSTTWSIMVWKASSYQGDKSQTLDIELFDGDCTALLALLSGLYARWATTTGFNQRCHVLVAQLDSSKDICAQLAIRAWSKIVVNSGSTLNQNAIEVKMDEHKKKGTIKLYTGSVESGEVSTKFELIPSKHGQDTSKSPIKLLSKLRRVSKGSGVR